MPDCIQQTPASIVIHTCKHRCMQRTGMQEEEEEEEEEEEVGVCNSKKCVYLSVSPSAYQV